MYVLWKTRSACWGLLVVLLVCVMNEDGVSGEYQCPEEWSIHGDQCYYINDTLRITWHQAKQKCTDMNATMAVITTEAFNRFLRGRVSSDVWLGGRDKTNSGTFMWEYGDTLEMNYTNWDDGSPDNAAENCACLHPYGINKGKWSDRSCNKKQPFICEKPAGRTGCPTDWTVHIGKCYMFSSRTEMRTFSDARAYCQQQQGDLVVIDSTQEGDFLKDNLDNVYRWIGLTDQEQEGVWKWVNSVTEIAWSNWQLYSPNNGGNAKPDCVHMYGESYRGGKFNAESCVVNVGYICETRKTNVNQTCVTDWISSNSSCYLVSQNFTSWSGARRRCRQLGGDLAVVDTKAKVDFLRQNMRKSSWIGLHKVGEIYAWNDQTTETNYTYWYNNEPKAGYIGSNSANYDCVAVHATDHNLGKWTNLECDINAGYICEHSQSCTESASSNWLPFGGKCYSFNPDETAWVNATERCRLQKTGATLATITDQQTQQFINQHLSANSASLYWIGLSAAYMNDLDFRWVGSTTKLRDTDYTNWDTDQPAAALHEACMAMKGTGWHRRKGTWSDEYCMKALGFVCQLPANGEGTYYDFKVNGSVYKVIDARRSKESAEKHCLDLFHSNVSLFNPDTQEELITVVVELLKRYTPSAMDLWINGSSKDFSLTVDVDTGRPTAEGGSPAQMLLPEWRRPSTTPPPALEQQCSIIRCRKIWRRTHTMECSVTRHICCDQMLSICEKKIDLSDRSHNGFYYDFAFNGSVYKIMTGHQKTKDDATRACEHVMENGAEIATITSEEELRVISAETRIRHLGDEFIYWVEGNPINGSLPYTEFSRTPKQGEKCLVLQHDASDPDTRHSTLLQYTPTTCDGSYRFICEMPVDVAGVFADPSDDELHLPEKQVADSPTSQQQSVGCVGPCIGLAIAFPFGILFSVIITVYIVLSWRRRAPLGFSFHKDSDQVYLTT